MAEADIQSGTKTPPMELDRQWKPSSQNGKPTEPLPLSPEQTHVDEIPAPATDHERDRSPATYPTNRADTFSTPEHAPSSGAQQQEPQVRREKERNDGRSAGSASGDELPGITGRDPTHDSNRRGHTRTPPQPPPSQRIPLHASDSSNSGRPGTTQQRRTPVFAHSGGGGGGGGGVGVRAPPSIVSAISCSMCSATGVNSLWRRDRAGKPICGKCCEQLRRRLNPRYAAPSRGDLSSSMNTHYRATSSTANVFPIRSRRTLTPPHHADAPYPPRAPIQSGQRAPYPPTHVNGSPSYGSSSASHNGAQQNPYQGGSSSGGQAGRDGQAERYHDRSNGSDAQRLASMRYENGRQHQDTPRPGSGSGNGNNGGGGGGGAGITLPPLSSLERVADHYRSTSSSSNAGGGMGMGGIGGYRSKEPVALPAAYPRPSAPQGSGAPGSSGGGGGGGGAGSRQMQQGARNAADGSLPSLRGEERHRLGMGPSSNGGERDQRERQAPNGGSSAGLYRPPTNVSFDSRGRGTGASGGIVTEADIQAKRELLVEGRKWIFTMLDETTAMLRQLDDASLHVGGAE